MTRYSIQSLAIAAASAFVLHISPLEAVAQNLAAEDIGTTSANFLNMGGGARASALGDAFVAIADDATAGYWNPAGLPQIPAAEMLFMHNNWYQDITSDYLAMAFPLSSNVAFATGVSYLDYGAFEGYTADNEPTGGYSANAAVFSSSGALRLGPRLSIGVTGKILSEQIDHHSATGFAVDVGGLYRASLFSIGMNLMNLGNGLKFETDEFSLPRQLLFGVAFDLYDNRLKLASDIEIPNDRAVAIHQGVEYCYENTVFLRGGYVRDLDGAGPAASGALTLGFGVKYSYGALDYSYRPDHRLGDIQRISLTVSLRRLK